MIEQLQRMLDDFISMQGQVKGNRDHYSQFDADETKGYHYWDGAGDMMSYAISYIEILLKNETDKAFKENKDFIVSAN